MVREFVERREPGFTSPAVVCPLDRIIWEYRNGEGPEAIRAHCPTLNVKNVNGALASYWQPPTEIFPR